MKRIRVMLTILFIILIMFGLIATAIILTNKTISSNKTQNSPTNLFYQYSDTNDIFSWNLYNGKKASFDSTKSGYLYYIFNNETEKNNQNQLLIVEGEFSFWFRNNLKYSSNINNGKNVEKKLNIGKDLRNNWNSNNYNYPDSDITKKYNIERKVTLHDSYTDSHNRTQNYMKEYYTAYMDIYINSNNEIVYAIPKDISQISYVTKDEVNADAIQGNKTLLEGKKISNINNLIDSLDEPNYAIITNDSSATKLTYVWKVFDNYYFYYTMQVNYYINGAYIEKNTLKAPLEGKSISDFEYGIINKQYIYYANNELARLFDAKEKKYNIETWFSIDE